jgi:hypothetical protein
MVKNLNKQDKTQKALDIAVKSIRKSGAFGNISNIDFEWPTVEDLNRMLNNLPTKI